MAGSSSTVTYDEGTDGDGRYGGVKRVLIDWTSDDTTGAVTATTRKIVGEIVKVITDPSAGAAPDANYDVAITGEEGVDVLGLSVSNLSNRHTSNTEEIYCCLTDGTAKIAAFPVVCDVLTVAVSNAGNSKQGQIVIYYKPA